MHQNVSSNLQLAHLFYFRNSTLVRDSSPNSTGTAPSHSIIAGTTHKTRAGGTGEQHVDVNHPDLYFFNKNKK